MPDAVVAIIKLKNGKTGILPLPKIYQKPIEKAIKENEKLGEFQTIDFPGYHSDWLPNGVSRGQLKVPEGIKTDNLDTIVCESITNIEINSDLYKLFEYNQDYNRIYTIIEQVSKN